MLAMYVRDKHRQQQWIESAQTRLSTAGAARALPVVDLLICGPRPLGGLVVLDDDAGYDLAERHLPDIRAQRVVRAEQ
ncbi:MAG: PIN domain nuclease [Mycobacterium sp.]|nr:MAG: PIN domain nuclease [Mycobacterium sp.]